MQILKELKSKAKFPLFSIFLFIVIFGYVDFLFMASLPKTVLQLIRIFHYDSLLLCAVNIAFALIFIFASTIIICVNTMIIQGLLRYIRLIGAKIIILDEGLKIQSRSKEVFIPNSSIVHISFSCNKRSLFIVWNGKKREMSFDISNRIFGLDSVKEAGLILCERDGYIDDPRQALKERKALKKFNSFLWPFRNPYDIEDGMPQNNLSTR